VASRISATTVVHHQSDDDEHWAVLTGATVVAYCTTPDDAVRLAATMNDARRIGDQYEQTTPYAALGRMQPHTPKPIRCQGLTISSNPAAAASSPSSPSSR
jgi:hypothetical protein